MVRVFEFVPGTETTPPQIRNEHLGTPQEIADANAAVDAWYAEHAPAPEEE